MPNVRYSGFVRAHSTSWGAALHTATTRAWRTRVWRVVTCLLPWEDQHGRKASERCTYHTSQASDGDVEDLPVDVCHFTAAGTCTSPNRTSTGDSRPSEPGINVLQETIHLLSDEAAVSCCIGPKRQITTHQCQRCIPDLPPRKRFKQPIRERQDVCWSGVLPVVQRSRRVAPCLAL